MMKRFFGLYLLEPALLIASFLLVLVLAGSCNKQESFPIRNIERQSGMNQEYSCIDIPPEDLAAGLGRIFNEMSKKLGPIDSEPIIKDYLPLIRQGLYRSGFCGIRRLNINGTTVDIDIYFCVRDPASTLNIEVYLDGGVSPTFSMVNQYFVTSE